jgi:chromosome segregation ATPase
MDDLVVKIGELQAKNDAQDVKIGELQTKNDALEAALERMEARLERLTLEHAERVDHLDDRTTLLEAKSTPARLMPKLKPKPKPADP